MWIVWIVLVGAFTYAGFVSAFAGTVSTGTQQHSG